MNTKKVLIIGGGVAGCTSAYTLATHPDLKEKYDVTLFQMGWKLGGKGSSGRNFEYNDGAERNEEHGPHIWFGAYNNAWSLMKHLYKTFLDEHSTHGIFTSLRDPKSRAPIFKPSNQVGLCSGIDNSSYLWQIDYPIFKAEDRTKSPMSLLVSLLTTNILKFKDTYEKFKEKSLELTKNIPKNNKYLHLLEWDENNGHLNKLQILVSNPETYNKDKSQNIPESIRELSEFIHQAIKDTISSIEGRTPNSTRNYRTKAKLKLLSVADYLLTGLRIYFEEKNYKVFSIHGLNAKTEEGYIFDEEYLTQHAKYAYYETLETSDLLRAAYDSFYAYIQVEGKLKPSLGAGAGLRGLLWLFFQYDEHVTYRMQAGMGEVVFSPIYKLLSKPKSEKRNEVDFRFFHKVSDIEMDDDGQINKIHYIKQAQVKTNASNSSKYNPLQKTKDGMYCWRSSPDYDQLTPESRLPPIENPDNENQPLDDPGFESPWSNGNQIEEKLSVTIGDDSNRVEGMEHFDEVILAIPVESLSIIGKELKNHCPTIKEACDGLQTIRTTSCQLWIKNPDGDIQSSTPPELLGKKFGFVSPQAIAGANGDWDIWVDYSDVLQLESHNPEHCLHYSLYGTGVIPKELPKLDYEDETYPSRIQKAASENLVKWLHLTGYKIWPNLKWGRAFNERLLSTDSNDLSLKPYVRVNINPSDLYTTSAAGTLKYRFSNSDEEIKNLKHTHFAGDWINTKINLGCVEAAVISGLQAINSLGENIKITYPQEIYKYD